jgi:HopA1 effector protein family
MKMGNQTVGQAVSKTIGQTIDRTIDRLAWRKRLEVMSADRTGWWHLADGLEGGDWFVALAPEQRQQYNQRRLTNWLYRQLISGATTAMVVPECQRRMDGLDVDFAGGLHRQNQGQGNWDRGWLVGEIAADGTWMVSKQNLTVHISPDRHLAEGVVPQSGAMVRIKLPKNRIIADRYMAVGNAGQPVGDRWQIYLHCDRVSVMAVMAEFTTHLNRQNLPFSLAVPYEPLDYPRWDGGILLLERGQRAVVAGLCDLWQGELATLAAVPELAAALAPGMAIAPIAADTVDFGWECCRLLATALGGTPRVGPKRRKAIDAALATVNVDGDWLS